MGIFKKFHTAREKPPKWLVQTGGDKPKVFDEDKCASCGRSKSEVAEYHEEHGHNVEHSMRYDLVQDDTICEDCIDDILEDMLA